MIQSSLICGNGEIGSALGKVLKDYNPHFIDIDITKTTEDLRNQYDYLHIAIPFSDSFISSVQEYQERFKPKFTVIHSTVEIGTSRKLGAVFSSVTGIHPHLEESIRTFTKFLAGEKAGEVANYFRRVGLKVYLIDKQETLELAKLSQTTLYALMIEYVKDLKKICNQMDLPFSDVFTLPSMDYNRGYEELGRSEFKMPLLTPILTQQKGHCTRNNCDLWTTEFTEFIKRLNDSYAS